MESTAVVKLGRTQPGGAPLPITKTLEQAPGIGGKLVQHGYAFAANGAGTVRIGVWDSTPQIHETAPYSVDEAMLVIEGSVTMIVENGAARTFREGELFIIPKGLRCAWSQPAYVQKFYCVVAAKDGGDSGLPQAIASIPAPSAQPNGSTFEVRQLYSNVAGTMVAGTIHAAEHSCWDLSEPSYLFLYVDAGRMEISSSGESLLVGRGEAVVIPGGVSVRVKTIEALHARFVRARA